MPVKPDRPALKPILFRLSEDTLADLDYFAAANGITNRTEALRIMARQAARDIQPPKRTRKKTSE